MLALPNASAACAGTQSESPTARRTHQDPAGAAGIRNLTRPHAVLRRRRHSVASCIRRLAPSQPHARELARCIADTADHESRGRRHAWHKPPRMTATEKKGRVCHACMHPTHTSSANLLGAIGRGRRITWPCMAALTPQRAVRENFQERASGRIKLHVLQGNMRKQANGQLPPHATTEVCTASRRLPRDIVLPHPVWTNLPCEVPCHEVASAGLGAGVPLVDELYS